MRRIVFLIFILVVPKVFADAIQWQSDWKSAFQTAKQQHRLVFVDFFATWCEPCRTMEATVFRDAAVQQRLSDFVLLRVDVDRNMLGRSHRVLALPSYVVYDFAERERFRIEGSKSADLFSAAVEEIRRSAPSFVKAAELFDAKEDLEAAFLVGNTYSHVQMAQEAREAYKEARKLAEKKGNAETAQMAGVLSAFTFAREGNPSRAITLLIDLSKRPVSHDTEAYTWLALGNAYRLSKDAKSAREAYAHAKSIAAPGSTVYKEATAALHENPDFF